MPKGRHWTSTRAGSEGACAGTATPTGGGAAGQAYIAATNAAVTAYLGAQDSGELDESRAKTYTSHTTRPRGPVPLDPAADDHTSLPSM